MKGLRIDSQTSGQGKDLIGVEVMKNNFSVYLSNLLGIASSIQNRVTEIHMLSGWVHVAIEELTSRLNLVKELARENSKWILRFTNVHVPNHKELIPIIFVVKAYREKPKKGKKSK